MVVPGVTPLALVTRSRRCPSAQLGNNREMPRYDASKVQEALQFVKDQVPHQEIVDRTGIGLSTLSRHITEYRAGNRPDVDVGELPPAKSNPNRGRKGARGGGASLVRLTQHRSVATRADEMRADAGVLLEEAGRLDAESNRLKAEAQKLNDAADLLAEA